MTHEQFAKFVEATGYVTVAEKMEMGGFVHFGLPASGKSAWREPTPLNVAPQHPVVQITAEDAHAFCAGCRRWTMQSIGCQQETEFQHALLSGRRTNTFPQNVLRISMNLLFSRTLFNPSVHDLPIRLDCSTWLAMCGNTVRYRAL